MKKLSIIDTIAKVFFPTQKTYKVYWLEYHDPLENDGWVECECEDTFELSRFT